MCKDGDVFTGRRRGCGVKRHSDEEGKGIRVYARRRKVETPNAGGVSHCDQFTADSFCSSLLLEI